MARIRSIKPTFFKSDDVVALTLAARFTWIGLWVHADDYGRAIDDARLVKGDVWLLEDDVTVAIVAELLDELERKGRIRRYEVDGKRYLEIVNFAKHQVINKKSRVAHPAPPWGNSGSPTGALPSSSATTPIGERTEGEGEGEVEKEVEGEAAGAATSPFCLNHPKGTTTNCRACGDARRAHEAADRKRHEAPKPLRRSEALAGMCPVSGHENWPLPCDKCSREAEAA